MKTSKTDGVFKAPRKSPQSKAEATDMAVKSILKEESDKRQSLMRQQRQARLDRDAALADDPEPSPKKPARRASAKKTPGKASA